MLLVIPALLLTACSNPNYRVFTNDGRYHDCVVVTHQVGTGGWYCDNKFYPSEQVSYVLTTLQKA